MNREYHKWYCGGLGREMELLVFGHGGLPVLLFPSSEGRFYDYEDRGMVHAVSDKLLLNQIQLFCVDSVDSESWYNRSASPRDRIVRQSQYERYIMDEVVPLIRHKNSSEYLISAGCSFGGYHAANVALRHPDTFSGFLSMGGVFDVSGFLDGYFDEECYFHLPTRFLPNLTDPVILSRLRRNHYVLATGVDDHCLGDNQRMAELLQHKGISHQLEIWNEPNSHDWPVWKRMMQVYL